MLIQLIHYNTKSTDAQGKLKPRSVITRQEGGLGFLIIPRAQPNPPDSRGITDWGFNILERLLENFEGWLIEFVGWLKDLQG